MTFRITYDPVKREHTLATRNLSFEQARKVFDGPHFSNADDRIDYGEDRIITVGFLEGRMMIVVWTARGDTRHIISMRKANDREQAKARQRMD